MQEKDQTILKRKRVSDYVARAIVGLLFLVGNVLFGKRYAARAVVLESVAAIPGMVGAFLIHLRVLRHLRADRAWVEELIGEATNEHFHLLVYKEMAHLRWHDHVLVWASQAFFVVLYSLVYCLSPRTGHRIVGCLEEHAVATYTEWLEAVQIGMYPNRAASKMATQYWSLQENATLIDVIIATRTDEEFHRDSNHAFADRS